jgi:small subunit ribosomal protein S8
MVNDRIANLVIKIKNGGMARKSVVTAPYSKLTDAILTLLQKEGYIKSFSKVGKTIVKTVDIELAYNDDNTPKVESVYRISKLSKRVYLPSKAIKSVRNGYGTLVLSTPKGILSDREAKKQKVGGEALFKIW